jgi:hypothetical protein
MSIFYTQDQMDKVLKDKIDAEIIIWALVRSMGGTVTISFRDILDSPRGEQILETQHDMEGNLIIKAKESA